MAVRGSRPVAGCFAATYVAAVLSGLLDDLKPQPTRNGCGQRSLAKPFDAKPAKIRRLLRGAPEPGRTREPLDAMPAGGPPT